MASTIADFHIRLQEALDARKMKPSELSERTGISKSSISRYLSGEYAPSSSKIYKISRALEINATWLLGYDVPMSQSSNVDTIIDDLNSMGFKASYSVPISDRTEIKILKAYREADDLTKEMVLRLLKIEDN